MVMAKAKLYKEHYDNTQLVNALDADGLQPAFRIVCSRLRGPGKTYSFSKLLYTNFLEKGEKFILLTRNQGDLGDVASGIFDGYLQMEHPEVNMYEKIAMKGVFSKVYSETGTGDNKETSECGYVVPIRAADQIKKISSLFYDAASFYFDEFQPMNNSTYLKDELGLVYNIYKSIARGEGHATRYMPIYMASNTITLGNPYFEGLGLNGAIQSNTRFYRGHGVVFENCEVEGLAEEHANSPIDRAMTPYLKRRGNNMWINDNNSLVCKPKDWGRGRYSCTIIYNNQKLGVYMYPAAGLRYISRTYDKTCQYEYNLTLDGELNYPLLKTTPFLDTLKKEFFRGIVRVQDSGLQSMLMEVFG